MYDYSSDEYRASGEAPAHLIPLPAPSAANGPRRMPVKTRRVALDGEYAGWWVTVRTNAPFGLFLSMTQLNTSSEADQSAALVTMVELLPKMIHSWNFVDEDGLDLPCDMAGMRALPMDLINQLFAAIGEGETVPKGSKTPSGTI